jgi:Putative zinc-finger
MNHQQASESMAVERYLLGEMTPDVREEFEEHFFDCHECAMDMRATAAFLDNAKEQLGAELAPDLRAAASAPSRRRGSWLQSLFRPAVASPIFAILLLVIGYQGLLQHPAVNHSVTADTAEVVPAISLVNSRGGAGASIAVPAAGSFLLRVDIPTSEKYASYACDVMTPSGERLWTVPVSAEQADDTVSIHIPAGARQAGKYLVLIRGLPKSAGSAASEISRYSFELTSRS